MKVSEILANANPQPVSRGRNLYKIGWHDGYLVVTFQGRDAIYIYGKDGGGIAEAERDKILANPYPDALFSRLKKHWQVFKVEVKRDTV
jgi:hypothetical protein